MNPDTQDTTNKINLKKTLNHQPLTVQIICCIKKLNHKNTITEMILQLNT